VLGAGCACGVAFSALKLGDFEQQLLDYLRSKHGSLSVDGIVGLLQGIANVTPQSAIMIAVACVLMYLGIVKDYEPLLLVPIAAGCLLANLPLSPLVAEDGMLRVLYHAGITNELFPLLIFIGIGAPPARPVDASRRPRPQARAGNGRRRP